MKTPQKSQPSPTRFDITTSTPRYCNRTCRQASYRIAATVQGRTLYVAKVNITSLSRGVVRERPRCRTSARGALTARCRLPSACFGRLHRVWPSLFLFLLWLPWLVLFCTVLLSCVCKLLPSAIIVHPPLLPARWKRFLMRVIMPCRTGVGSTVCNGVVLSAFRVNIENGSKRALQLRLLLWVLRGRAFSGG